MAPFDLKRVHNSGFSHLAMSKRQFFEVPISNLKMSNKQSSEISSIDQYIDSFPAAVKKKLKELRKAIKSAAPEATERISYNMPTFYFNGNLVHFAAYANHIGFYPAPSGISAFQEDIKEYKHAKGSVQFPIDKPLPIELIRRIVEFRYNENKRNAQRLW